MSKQPIRKWNGIIRGWVEDDAAGNKIVRDFQGRIVARYEKQRDITRDFYGRIVGSGDQTLSLLPEDSDK